jgi:hypothetical protein
MVERVADAIWKKGEEMRRALREGRSTLIYSDREMLELLARAAIGAMRAHAKSEIKRLPTRMRT